jgi:uncharacterized OsmC-like protein
LDDLRSDEPPPLGKGSGPSPSHLLAAAVGNCLAASLAFCMRRAGAMPDNMSADVQVELVRNEAKRLRIGGIRVKLHPNVPPEHLEELMKCKEVFEQFCTVTESVRKGIAVEVEVDLGVS